MTVGVVELDIIRQAYEAWNRRDIDALLALTHPDIEIQPLVAGVTSVAPWHGHDGVRRLVEDADQRWHRFEIRCDDFVEIGDRVVVFVHVETAVHEGAPVVEGDVAHLVEINDGRFTRFTAYRDRDEAVAAAGA